MTPQRLPEIILRLTAAGHCTAGPVVQRIPDLLVKNELVRPQRRGSTCCYVLAQGAAVELALDAAWRERWARSGWD
ncbi:hypothetical protein LAJ19_16345 (plasmid) [Deinococcus taeanensis]|uniref:hypothetical protein n=1 Tax=Deinococcus taeanensis TaxID=2737050 RepID=UPI001CDBBD2C|nr:hypothetical protein [Deinococcus taeanensis]UBV44726.1 hypothetical protein LAJ19_16345 [Deinococcus taeanensis]